MADILAVLYKRGRGLDPARLARARAPGRQQGHAPAIVYAALAETGLVPVAELDSYTQSRGRLAGHVSTEAPGVEVSTGSLGYGLPIAAGMALAAQLASVIW